MKVKPLPLLLFLITFTFSCKKDQDEVGINKAVLEEHAAFNNNLIPGVKNIFVDETLAPNSANELFMKIAIEDDTLLYFGQTDGQGKVTYIHTTIFIDNSTKDQLVTEIYPEQAKCVRYLIQNGKRNRYVVETIGHGNENYEFLLLDYDWNNNTHSVLQNDLFSNHQLIDSYSSNNLRTSEGDPIDQPFDAWDSQKQAQMIGGYTFTKWLSENMPATAAFINKYYNDQNTVNTAPNTDVDNLKKEPSDLKASQYGAPLISSNLGEPIGGIDLEPDIQSSNLDFVEGEYDDLFLQLKIKPKNVNSKTMPRVVVNCDVVVPGTDEVLLSTIAYNEFKSDIIQINFNTNKTDALRGHKEVEIRYWQAQSNRRSYSTVNAKLQWIEPVLLIDIGLPVPSSILLDMAKTYYFKLANKDRSQIIGVDYSKVTISNNTNPNIKIAFERGFGLFGLTFSTTDLQSARQSTTFTIAYKGIKVMDLNVILTLTVYRISAVEGLDNQSAQAGQPLPKMLQVRVTGTDQMYADKAMVTWNVKSGGGKLSSSSTYTNRQGVAEVSWTLGQGTDQQIVEASVTSDIGTRSVTFNAYLESQHLKTMNLGSWKLIRASGVNEDGPYYETKLYEHEQEIWTYLENNTYKLRTEYNYPDKGIYQLTNDVGTYEIDEKEQTITYDKHNDLTFLITKLDATTKQYLYKAGEYYSLLDFIKVPTPTARTANQRQTSQTPNFSKRWMLPPIKRPKSLKGY